MFSLNRSFAPRGWPGKDGCVEAGKWAGFSLQRSAALNLSKAPETMVSSSRIEKVLASK
jgi:hypothetical protein